MKRIAAALVAALSLSAPLAASAQEVPSYAAPAAYSQNEDVQIRGRIAGFDGGYQLQVTDDQGYTDNVQLHDGTIINPTGLTLEPGMVVSILGYNAGNFFSANEIDTPYRYTSGIPYYEGHPWNYYGPSIGLDFFFNTGGWWHGGVFRGGPVYYGHARAYNNVHVTNVYRGGNFNGRDYVAPVTRGGYRPAAAPAHHDAAPPEHRDAPAEHTDRGGEHHR